MKRPQLFVLCTAIVLALHTSAQLPATYTVAIAAPDVEFGDVHALCHLAGGRSFGLADLYNSTTQEYVLGVFDLQPAATAVVIGFPGGSFTGYRMIQADSTLYVLSTLYESVSGDYSMVWLEVDTSDLSVRTVLKITAPPGVGIEPMAMARDSGGTFHITGEVYTGDHPDVFVLPVAPGGALGPMRTFGGDSDQDDGPTDIQWTGSGLVVAGYTNPNTAPFQRSGLLLSVTAQGVPVASKKLEWFKGLGSARVAMLQTAPHNDTLHVSGSTIIGADGNGPMLTARFDLGLAPIDHHVLTTGNIYLRSPMHYANGKQVLTGESSQLGGAPGMSFLVVDPQDGSNNGSAHDMDVFFNFMPTALMPDGGIACWTEDANAPTSAHLVFGDAPTGGNNCSSPAQASLAVETLTDTDYPLTLDSIPLDTISIGITVTPLPVTWSTVCAPLGLPTAVSTTVASYEVWPVPANGHCTIRAPHGDGFAAAVHDSRGRTVLRGRAMGRELRLDVSGLRAGVYAIELARGVDREFVKLLVE